MFHIRLQLAFQLLNQPVVMTSQDFPTSEKETAMPTSAFRTYRSLRGALRALGLALGFLLLATVPASALAASAQKTADVVIIGAGPAGLNAARQAVLAGAKKVIVLEMRPRTPGESDLPAWGTRPQLLN